MSPVSDQEVQQIVERVLARLQGGAQPAAAEQPAATPSRNDGWRERKVAIGADHGGFHMKEELKTYLEGQGYTLIDCGTHSTDSVDYPDIAEAVATKVASREGYCGIIIDGAGIGSCMAANKVPGVRAALCYDQSSAANSREHNHANVLTLGAGLIGMNLAKQIVDTWLNTPSGEGRHAMRVAKIMEIERRAWAR
jgi:ribose 5-phosphate isomerase B